MSLRGSSPAKGSAPGKKKAKLRIGFGGFVLDLASDMTDNDVTLAALKKQREEAVAERILEDVEPTSEVSMADSLVNIVIVGGGPVGLWTAVQIKIRKRAKTNIVILEKYEEYRRSHIVKIDPSSFVEAATHPVLQQLEQDLKENTKIRTSEIEKRLLDLASELGIRIIKPDHVTSPQKLKSRFPNASIIIGADGSHSIVRKVFFGDEMRYRVNLQYLIEVKYEVEGSTKQISLTAEGFKTMQVMESVVTEVVGKQYENVTPVTFRIFVDKRAYEACSEATFKNPFRIPYDEDKIDPEVLFKIKVWLNAKKIFVNEKVIDDSIKITATKLDMYAAKAVVRGDGETTVFLVGDAAFGVPFFRSMNNGLLCGTRLSQEIASYISDPGEPDFRLSDSVRGTVAAQFLNYGRYVKRLSKTESIIAEMKSQGLNVANWGTMLSAKVPWQTAKWSADEINSLYSSELAHAEYESEEFLTRSFSRMRNSTSNKKKSPNTSRNTFTKSDEKTYIIRGALECIKECGRLATIECKKCGPMCNECLDRVHEELLDSVSWSDMMKDPNLASHVETPITTTGAFCDVHTDTSMDVYDCHSGKMVCMKCLLSSTHKGTFVFADHKNTRPDAQMILKVREALDNVETSMNWLQTHHNNIEKKISNEWDTLISIAITRKNEMLQQAKDVMDRKMSMMQKQRDDLNQIIDELRIGVANSSNTSEEILKKKYRKVNYNVCVDYRTQFDLDLSQICDQIRNHGSVQQPLLRKKSDIVVKDTPPVSPMVDQRTVEVEHVETVHVDPIGDSTNMKIDQRSLNIDFKTLSTVNILEENRERLKRSDSKDDRAKKGMSFSPSATNSRDNHANRSRKGFSMRDINLSDLQLAMDNIEESTL